jgi:hypothetical protein
MTRRLRHPRLALVVSIMGSVGCGGASTSTTGDAAIDRDITPPDDGDSGPTEMDGATVADAVDAFDADAGSRDAADAGALDSSREGGNVVDAAPDGETSDAGDGQPACDGVCSLPIASGPDWSVYDDDPSVNPAAQLLGPARHVCLNASNPVGCPSGALIYGGASGWGASLASIPNAHWVWAPGIAVTDVADLKRFVFVRTFTLGQLPSGWISLAADDQAEIRVNGRTVGAVGSVTDVSKAGMAQSQLTTYDLSPFLSSGNNTVSVVAQNGPPSFAGCAASCTYASNTAGTVFGGVLNYR